MTFAKSLEQFEKIVLLNFNYQQYSYINKKSIYQFGNQFALFNQLKKNFFYFILTIPNWLIKIVYQYLIKNNI